MAGPPEFQGPSTRPYLLRALHAWCTENGFTPYVAVHVDASVQVPMEYVDNHEIVLNIGIEATSGLKIGNEFLEFRARFRGVLREIVVPIDHVVAIYARENGQGMAFPVPTEAGARAAHNRPYAGGYALERHAAPRRGIHALQLEVDRSSYLDEDLREVGPGFATTATLVATLVRRLAAEVALLGGGAAWPVAAE